MRVLFLESNPMWIYGLPNGFRDIGHIVEVSGPLTEHNIPRIISEFKPDLIITMGWTSEHRPRKRKWIEKYVKEAKVPLVYWATEDPIHTRTFSMPLIKTIKPDFVFTVTRAKVDYYKSKGFKAAHLDFGFHDNVHRRVNSDSQYICSIAVVANAYPKILKRYTEIYRHESMLTLIQPLLRENIRIDFWGKHWDEMKPIIGYDIPCEWIHGYLPYTEANKVYSSADIVIGLQNDTDQLTQRTYEILGSEGFLLTSDTPEVRRLFEPERDLIVSASSEETLGLVNYYLNNPEARERIRKQGKIAVANHSYKNRAEYMIEVLKEEGILPKRIKI